MWKSTKFSRTSYDVVKKQIEEALLKHFDFGACEGADPTILTSSQVLEVMGMSKTKPDAVAVGKVLRRMVGENRFMRRDGKFGRYYALPPRKEEWLG